MRIRAIELTNVRRFAGQKVRLGGIGDGVSVLAAPNETGKSTLFDALHALMFLKHTARGGEVRRLQPLGAGGAPQVAIELETEGGAFRVEKRWLGRPSARVLDGGGRLLAQDDEAEAWLEALLAAGLSGPAGMLWVRQGRAGLDQAGTLEARRDLLSSVAGEIDAMTGGRRMDAVRGRVEAALAPLATATGRPKAGGAWDSALREAETLAARADELAAGAARLSEALAARRRAERRRAELEEPGPLAELQARLSQARARDRAARDHARQRSEARQALALAELRVTAARQARDRLRALAEESTAASRIWQSARSETARAALAEEEARTESARAEAALAAAEQALKSLQTRLRAAEARARALAASARIRDLAKRLEEAEAKAEEAVRTRATRATLPVTPARLKAAEAAAEALARLEAQAEARAVTLSFTYSGTARAARDGKPVEAPLHLIGPAVLDLPGLGRLSVDPGSRQGDDLPRQLAEARASLGKTLEACGVELLAQARAALRRAEALEDAARLADGFVAALVPEGVDSMRRALARARAEAEAEADTSPEGEDPQALAAARARAETETAKAAAAARAAQELLARAGADLAGARATEAARRDRAVAASDAVGTAEEHAAALTAAARALAEAEAEVAGAGERARTLAAEAPDGETIAADLARAQGALQALEDEKRGLDRDLAGLQGRISVLASEGIEEELAETQGRLDEARARAEALAAEVAALTRLRTALDEARSAAREAYFQPVARELGPLLSLLHPGAALHLSDASLLPVTLERNGAAEGFDILSGGTQEQIAVLTRLAFARLFARQGHPVPVILDDALVQTDDDRIEAMFTALHRIARDQQVIVLTCRQRAFLALGGQRLEMETEALT